MGHITGLKCRECSREYPIEPVYVCEFCAGRIKRDESTVICITGNGLKTQEALQGHTISPHFIKPSISAFEEVLEKINKR